MDKTVSNNFIKELFEVNWENDMIILYYSHGTHMNQPQQKSPSPSHRRRYIATDIPAYLEIWSLSSYDDHFRMMSDEDGGR